MPLHQCAIWPHSCVSDALHCLYSQICQYTILYILKSQISVSHQLFHDNFDVWNHDISCITVKFIESHNQFSLTVDIFHYSEDGWLILEKSTLEAWIKPSKILKYKRIPSGLQDDPVCGGWKDYDSDGSVHVYWQHCWNQLLEIGTASNRPWAGMSPCVAPQFCLP